MAEDPSDPFKKMSEQNGPFKNVFTKFAAGGDPVDEYAERTEDELKAHKGERVSIRYRGGTPHTDEPTLLPDGEVATLTGTLSEVRSKHFPETGKTLIVHISNVEGDGFPDEELSRAKLYIWGQQDGVPHARVLGRSGRLSSWEIMGHITDMYGDDPAVGIRFTEVADANLTTDISTLNEGDTIIVICNNKKGVDAPRQKFGFKARVTTADTIEKPSGRSEAYAILDVIGGDLEVRDDEQVALERAGEFVMAIIIPDHQDLPPNALREDDPELDDSYIFFGTEDIDGPRDRHNTVMGFRETE